MDAMTEVLLTVWALSQEHQRPAIKDCIPSRLQGTFKKARRQGLIVVEKDCLYLDEAGAAMLDKQKDIPATL